MTGGNIDYKNVARVVGKIGKNGEVKVVPIDDLPFLLHEGTQVFLSPPRIQGVRWARVQSVNEIGDGWCVKFEGIDSAADAFALEGRLCLVARADLAQLEEYDNFDSIIGSQVIDEQLGRLGLVTDVLTNPMQATLVVGDDTQPERYLIPYVDEFVLDETDDAIFVRIPQSLASLNK